MLNIESKKTKLVPEAVPTIFKHKYNMINMNGEVVSLSERSQTFTKRRNDTVLNDLIYQQPEEEPPSAISFENENLVGTEPLDLHSTYQVKFLYRTHPITQSPLILTHLKSCHKTVLITMMTYLNPTRNIWTQNFWQQIWSVNLLFVRVVNWISYSIESRARNAVFVRMRSEKG